MAISLPVKRIISYYSGLKDLPSGHADDSVTAGCIVLEGGAFRGVYTSGVLDALMQAGLNFQCTVGVSAGSMNGMNYVSGQIGRSARINLRYRHDKHYVGLRALLKNRGIIGFDFVFGHMEGVPEFDQQRFSDPRRSYYAVVTNLNTGQPEFIGKDSGASIYQAVRASASMPYISRPVMIRQQPCLDGGCSVNIPYQWAMDQGFEKIVVVRTRPRGFRKNVKPVSGRMPRLESLYRNYPAFKEQLMHSEERYNRECAELETLEDAGRIAVIAPSQPVTVGRLEPDMEKLGALYHMGYNDANTMLPALQTYLRGEAAT